MVIERQNILELIGKNKSKYSSCIIVSYTFDFTFFEERILPALRTSQIKNINVFVDGNYLDNTLEDIGINTFKNLRSYSLNPIYTKGIFHPKIIFLAGPKHGLLIIGSGNFTSSGINTNDEVWGAFHINSLDSQNAPLIANVWHYLEGLFNQVNGFNTQKINWIYHRATWVNELSSIRNDGFIKLNENIEAAFVANTADGSIYKRITKLLPTENLKELNIISPYFDEKGSAIETLRKHFNPTSINIITDTEFGLLPTKISDDLKDSVPFYDWKDCLTEFDKRFNRLHAKLFQFIYSDETEYLMLGSANATMAALGSNEIKPINAEAGLILKRKHTKGYLNELGISFQNANPIEVSKYPKRLYIKGDSPFPAKNKNTIIHAELNGHKLYIVVKNKLEQDSHLVICGLTGAKIEDKELKPGDSKFSVETDQPENIGTVFIEVKGERTSNRALVHNVDILAKCNPDPNQIELNNILSALEDNPDGDQYIELLKYADYNWVEIEIEGHKQSEKKGSTNKRKKKKEANHRAITKEEFDSLDSLQQIEQRILMDPTTQIADILQIVSKGLNNSREDYTESEEESLILEDEDSRSGDGNAAIETSFERIRGKMVEEAIRKHLKKVGEYYNSLLAPLKTQKNFQDSPLEPITIKDCSHISIAIDLMYIFQGKSYSFIATEFALLFTKEQNENIHNLEKKFKLRRLEKSNKDRPSAVFYEVNQEWFQLMKTDIEKLDSRLLVHQGEYKVGEYSYPFIDDGVYNSSENYCIKRELIKSLGTFIICSNLKAGFKQYDYEALNDKIGNLRKALFERATFLICNLKWSDNELMYRKLLLLNLLNSVNPDIQLEFDSRRINQILQEQLHKATKKSPIFPENIEYYLSDIIPSYKIWKTTYNNDKTELLVKVDKLRFGDIVYNMNFGFCSVIKYNNHLLQITAPGLDWDEFTRCPALEINYPQSKIIGF